MLSQGNEQLVGVLLAVDKDQHLPFVSPLTQ
jgi:hypothetical protein